MVVADDHLVHLAEMVIHMSFMHHAVPGCLSHLDQDPIAYT